VGVCIPTRFLMFTVFLFRWEELISSAQERKQLLEEAEQVHKFVLDATETNDHMNEKVCPRYLSQTLR